MTITPEKYIIEAEDAVDIIGRSFNFTHQKGLVEWIKNSWDAYQRHPERLVEPPGFFVALHFLGSGKSFREVRVVDFCGMTSADIDRAFKRWFDMQAATKGASKDKLPHILGGHGNGGKFYMRQMFSESRITTWLDGKLTEFGFNPKKEYGFSEGRKDKICSLEEALGEEFLNINLIPAEIIKALERGHCGFTVVRGWKPRGTGVQLQFGRVIQGLREDAQMSRLLDYLHLAVWRNDEIHSERILPERPDEHPDLEPLVRDLPLKLTGEDETFDLIADPERPEVAGSLTVKAADRPLTNRQRAYNRIDIIGRFGVVASYPMSELPITELEAAEWIFGTLEAPCVEDPEQSIVENARERLISSPKTTVLLRWIAKHVDELSRRVSKKNEREKRHLQAAETARLSRMLNKYARQFLNDFFVQVTGGSGKGSGFGGKGGGGSSVHTGKGHAGDGGGGGGNEGDGGGGAGDKVGRTRRFPEVLVAGVDEDPFSSEGQTLDLTERHPTLYQRMPLDVDARIYWINTLAPYPRFILDKFGEGSAVWKNYVLIRHRDVVIQEAFRHMTDREGLDLTIDIIKNRMDELTDDFLNSLDQNIADSILKRS